MFGSYKDRVAELEAKYPEWHRGTLWSLFLATARQHPQREFAVFANGRTYTYQQAYCESEKLARTLTTFGVRPGDYIAIQSANSAEALFLCLALSKLKAVKVSLNTSLGPLEFKHVLVQSKARMLFCDGSVNIEGEWPKHLETIIYLSLDNYNPPPLRSECKAFALAELIGNDVSGEADDPLSHDSISPDAGFDWSGGPFSLKVSDIMFTSGTSGCPKGAMLTNDMLLRAAFANCLNRGFEDARRVFIPLPLFHSYAYVEGLLATLLVAGTVLFSKEKLSPAQALQFMREQQANDILLIPSLAINYLNQLEEAPLEFPTLHAIYCSASSAPAWLWPKLRNAFGVRDIITGYGMTEVCGATMQTTPFDSDEVLTSRVGRTLYGGVAGLARYNGYQIEYKVVDPETGAKLEPGEVGELRCRGVVVAKGYCNDPYATSEACDEQGWMRTGDIGRFDKDGYLELQGRAIDTYKINGENVSTKFIEQILYSSPNVKTVEIVGVPDERLGAVGAAFVQLYEDTEEQRVAFEELCKRELARHQVPKYYFFLSEDDWPRTSTGKVKKTILRSYAKKTRELSINKG